MQPNYNAPQQAPGQHPLYEVHRLHMLRMMNHFGIHGQAPAPAPQLPPQQDAQFDVAHLHEGIRWALAAGNLLHLNTLGVPMTQQQQNQWLEALWEDLNLGPAANFERFMERVQNATGRAPAPRAALGAQAQAPRAPDAQALAPAPPAHGAPASFHLGAPRPAPQSPRPPNPYSHQLRVLDLAPRAQDAQALTPAPPALGVPAPPQDEHRRRPLQVPEPRAQVDAPRAQRAQNRGAPVQAPNEPRAQVNAPRAPGAQNGDAPEEPRARVDAPRAPRHQTPPPQTPLYVRSQEDQELIARLTAQNKKLKMHNEAERIKTRVLGELHGEMSDKIKELEKKIKEEMELKEKVEQENRELKKLLGEEEQDEEQAPGPSEPRRRTGEGDEEPPKKIPRHD